MGAFIENAHNLILVGGTGTAKTHLAAAPGVAAIHKEKRVRGFNAVDLVNLLEKDKASGKSGNLARQFRQIDQKGNSEDSSLSIKLTWHRFGGHKLNRSNPFGSHKIHFVPYP
ncbi:ATP-binding protein [Iodobacter ciconiae]|uniref:ATP-binding protein n=1 Tax=Iodobacter ciconiae TaxID=2496266 RepID=UPI0019D00B95|nr:ATP-binding protein [Iodobacter ciconiae]